MNTIFLKVFVIIGVLLLCRTDGQLMSGSLFNVADAYMVDSMKDVGTEIFSAPENSNTSIKYYLYTPSNPIKGCIIEPNTEALKNCPMNSSLPTIFIIHGFIVELYPGNLFEVMKDNLLKIGSYNVIVMDWTKYDKPPYTLALSYALKIGSKLAEFIDFFKKNAGIKHETIHLIGHSLGAHLAGAAGERTPNLGMITGLDPAGPVFSTLTTLPRLDPSDANFVKVIHTSDGFGIHELVGDMDFFVNGGKIQPFCRNGTQYRRPSGNIDTVNTELLKSFCFQEASILYYMESMKNTNCRFFGTMCSSYEKFKQGSCPSTSSTIRDMGFHGEKISGVPPLSKFYLNTHKNTPFCL